MPTTNPKPDAERRPKPAAPGEGGMGGEHPEKQTPDEGGMGGEFPERGVRNPTRGRSGPRSRR